MEELIQIQSKITMEDKYKCKFCAETYHGIAMTQKHLEEYHKVPSSRNQHYIEKLHEQLEPMQSGHPCRKRKASENKTKVIKKPKLEGTSLEESNVEAALYTKSELAENAPGEGHEGNDEKVSETAEKREKLQSGSMPGPKHKALGKKNNPKKTLKVPQWPHDLRMISRKKPVVKLQRLLLDSKNLKQLSEFEPDDKDKLCVGDITSDLVTCKQNSNWSTHSEYVCHVCDFKSESYSAIVRHSKDAHDIVAEYHMKKEAEHKNVHITYGTGPEIDYSDWLNQCQFACSVCSFRSKKYYATVKHTKAVHEVNAKCHMEKTVYHNCILCHTLVKQYSGALTVHFNRKHNMTPREYHNKFILAIDKQQEGSDGETYVVDIKYGPGSDAAFSDWINQCEFACLVCSFRSKSYWIMKRHSKASHDVTAKFNMEKIVYHECIVCCALVKQNTNDLSHHCKSKHGLTPSEYHKKFIIA